jgi:hypothetical protein
MRSVLFDLGLLWCLPLSSLLPGSSTRFFRDACLKFTRLFRVACYNSLLSCALPFRLSALFGLLCLLADSLHMFASPR